MSQRCNVSPEDIATDESGSPKPAPAPPASRGPAPALPYAHGVVCVTPVPLRSRSGSLQKGACLSIAPHLPACPCDTAAQVWQGVCCFGEEYRWDPQHLQLLHQTLQVLYMAVWPGRCSPKLLQAASSCSEQLCPSPGGAPGP